MDIKKKSATITFKPGTLSDLKIIAALADESVSTITERNLSAMVEKIYHDGEMKILVELAIEQGIDKKDKIDRDDLDKMHELMALKKYSRKEIFKRGLK